MFVSRCNHCKRELPAPELRQYAVEAGRSWWMWQVEGWCAGCTQLEYEIALEEAEKEGVIKDGC